MMDIRQLASLNLAGITISAQINTDGTLSSVEGSFNKLLGAAKDKALPRIHTVIVHPNQKDIPPELSDPHAELRVVKAWTLEEAVQRIVVDEQTRWGDIPDYREFLHHHRDYVGREWLKQQVEAAVENVALGRGPAYILLTGKPGAGKSAFVAHQVSKEAGAVYHIIRRGDENLDDPEVLLSSLTAQLRRLYALTVREEEQELPTAVSFRRVLRQISRKLEDGQHQTIWIDGLDEAFGPLGRFSDKPISQFIPLNGLPEGIVMILTSRPGGEHLNWLEDTEQFFSISMDAQLKNIKEDIRAYLARQNETLALGLKPEFIDQLVEASEGSFVAAVRYLHQNPHLEGVLEEWQLNPETIPRGMNGWLNWQWQWLLRFAKEQNIPENVLMGVLGYLAVTDEKERAKILFYFLSGNQLEEYWDRVLQLSSELVEPVHARGRTDTRYRFFHPQFAEFIWEKLKHHIESKPVVREADLSTANRIQKDSREVKPEPLHVVNTNAAAKQRTLVPWLVLGIVLVLAALLGSQLLTQQRSATEQTTNNLALTTSQIESAISPVMNTPSASLPPMETANSIVSGAPTEIPSTAIPNPTVVWSNSWSQGDGFDAYTTGWRGYRNLIKDVAWATDGEGEFQGERVMKIFIQDDLLPENWKKYEQGSGTTDPGYFEVDWHHYIHADGFNFTPNQEFTPPLALPLVYESSFMIGDDFRRANTDDANPIRFDFTHGELNLLSLFDTIDDKAWYLMANLNLEGPLDQLYPVVISSGDVRGEPGRNVGDVYLNLLTPYGQLHPLQANKRYWYQVVVTADKQIMVSFRDAKEEGYHVYLQGYLSEAVNPQVASFHGPLSLNWIGSGPEYRIISGTFIRGVERFITWASSETASQLRPTDESFPAQVQTLRVPTQAEEFLDGIQIEKLDGFDTSSKANWDLGKIGAISNGMLEMTGDEIDWNQLGLNTSILEGEGVLFFARYSRGGQFDMFLQSGAWGKESYRRFGINGGGKPSEHVWFGPQYTGDFLSGDFSPEPDRWYCVLMAIDNQANVLVAIWNPDHSEENNFYTKELDEESQGQYWGLVFEVFRGTLQIDDFYIISFDSIK